MTKNECCESSNLKLMLKKIACPQVEHGFERWETIIAPFVFMSIEYISWMYEVVPQSLKYPWTLPYDGQKRGRADLVVTFFYLIFKATSSQDIAVQLL